LKRYEEAIECYNRAIELNSSNEGILNNKGACLLHLGRDVEALECFNKAIELNPSYDKAWHNKEDCLEKLEKYEEAIECCDKLIELNPDDKESWIYKLNCLEKLEKYEDELACYDKLIELEDDGFYWILKAECLMKLERYEEALKCYVKFRVQDPLDEVNKIFNSNLEKIEKCEDELSYDKLMEIEPNIPFYWIYKAECLMKLERYEEALECCDKLIELNPDYRSFKELLKELGKHE
jgi:tetratricopeptide (TPR) repeat protein